jgi:hypothetical protein
VGDVDETGVGDVHGGVEDVVDPALFRDVRAAAGAGPQRVPLPEVETVVAEVGVQAGEDLVVGRGVLGKPGPLDREAVNARRVGQVEPDGFPEHLVVDDVRVAVDLDGPFLVTQAARGLTVVPGDLGQTVR